MPFTIPTGGKVANVSTGLTTDLDNLYPAVTAIAGINVQNSIYSGGADPTGVADSAAAFNAAIGALPATGGVVYVPPGTYKLNSATSTLGVGQYIIGAGKDATFINFAGTGDCFRQTFSGTYSGVTTVGGGILNLTIDGTSSGAGSAGIHAGDIESLTYDGTYVRNFSGAGSIGYHFDNTADQTERLTGELHATNCTSHFVFDVSGALTSTSSFARANLLMFYTASSVTQNGVVLQNGANVYDMVRFAIFGNHASSAAGSPGSVLTITGTVPAGHPGPGVTSRITNGRFSVGMETATNTVAPITVTFGASGNAIVDTEGMLDFSQGVAFTGSNIGTTGSSFRHFGPIHGDATLVSTTYDGTWAQGALATGGTIFVTRGSNVSVNPGGAITGVIIAVGARDGQLLMVSNISANSITFAASGTSNVAAGASATIPANTNRAFRWNAATNLWYGGA